MRLKKKMGVTRSLLGNNLTHDMARNYRPIWTADEDERLHQHYPTRPLDELLPLFPGRNLRGIYQRASRLELVHQHPSPGAWSDEHMAILREHYPTKGAAYVAALVGRSPNRVTSHAHDHLIRFTGIRNPKRATPKQYPAKRAVGRPRKVPVEAPTPVAPLPLPALAAPRKPVAAPTKAKTGTPLLNARAAQKRQKQKEQAEQPKAFVTAQQIRDLRADHPARWAYTRAASQGPAAASAAFYAAMQQYQAK